MRGQARRCSSTPTSHTPRSLLMVPPGHTGPRKGTVPLTHPCFFLPIQELSAANYQCNAPDSSFCPESHHAQFIAPLSSLDAPARTPVRAATTTINQRQTTPLSPKRQSGTDAPERDTIKLRDCHTRPAESASRKKINPSELRHTVHLPPAQLTPPGPRKP